MAGWGEKESLTVTKEDKDRLADYFDPEEIVLLLGLSTKDILEAFEEDAEEAQDELEEIIGYRSDD